MKTLLKDIVQFLSSALKFSRFKKIFRFNNSISLQLRLIIFLLIVILIVSHAVLIQNRLEKHIINKQSGNAERVLELTVRNVEEEIKNSSKILLMLSKTYEMVKMRPIEEEALLIQTSLENTNFECLTIFDKEGKEIACSEIENKHEKKGMAEILSKIQSGNTYRSQVEISKDYHPYVVEAYPIADLNDNFRVLHAEINLRGIWEYIDYINSCSVFEKLFIVSKNGVLCAYEDKKLVLKNDDPEIKRLVNASLSANENPVYFQLNNRENYFLLSKELEKLNYLLVYQVNVSVIKQEIKKLNWMIFFVSFLILIIGIIIIQILAKRISNPILDLVRELEFVGQIEVNRKMLYERRKDEIGTLFRAFYDMNKSIIEAKARERLAIIGESAMGISHEIKNPMTAIKNFISLLIMNPSDKEIFNKFKYVVPEEIERIQKMIDDLSNLSIGKPLNKTDFLLEKMINDVSMLFESDMISKRIQFVKTMHVQEPRILGDYEKLKSVFVNLILNSIQALPEGGLINIEVMENSCAFQERKKELKIVFEDNGVGINPEIIHKIFDPFFTTKRKGLGIGLAVVKGIIEQHNGAIEVSSGGEGTGTIFTIKIPIF